MGFGDVLAEEGRALAAQLTQAGHTAFFFTLDLADPASVDAFVAQGAAALGGIDALINNAAITNSGGKLSTELDVSTWDAVMNVNVRGVWLVSNAALPHLAQSGRGAIVRRVVITWRRRSQFIRTSAGRSARRSGWRKRKVSSSRSAVH